MYRPISVSLDFDGDHFAINLQRLLPLADRFCVELSGWRPGHVAQEIRLGELLTSQISL
jgi:hypothetical protein